MSKKPTGYQYIKQTTVRRLAKSFRKRVSVAFLSDLDLYIRNKVEEAAFTPNGKKKTIDAGVSAKVLAVKR